MKHVVVRSGPGSWVVRDWRELWACVFRVLAHALYMSQHNKCTCGCEDLDCDYCAHECMVGVS